jgi:hypothetical protein
MERLPFGKPEGHVEGAPSSASYGEPEGQPPLAHGHPGSSSISKKQRRNTPTRARRAGR